MAGYESLPTRQRKQTCLLCCILYLPILLCHINSKLSPVNPMAQHTSSAITSLWQSFLLLSRRWAITMMNLLSSGADKSIYHHLHSVLSQIKQTNYHFTNVKSVDLKKMQSHPVVSGLLSGRLWKEKLKVF